MLVKGIMGGFSTSKPQVYKTGDLLPVLSAKELLASGRHQAVLRQLKDICHLPEDYYEAFYVPAVEAFVEFVQILPVEWMGPLSGLMNEGIARAMIALQTYQLAHKEEMDPLRAYAVFTAGLFRDISHAVINQQVVLTDEEGKFIENWSPLSGSMLGRSDFYRLLFRPSIYQRLDVTLRHLLARQLMPKQGYEWITSDFHVLADWFDAISGEEGGGGNLVLILSYVKDEEILALQNSLVQVSVDQKASPATEHGQAFYEWLIEALEKGKIKTNTADSGVHIVNEGVFLERPRLFKEFLEVYNQPVTLSVVYAQFGNFMGIVKKGGSDFMNSQYFSEYPEAREAGAAAFASPMAGRQQSLRDGMVLASPGRVFLNARIPATTPMLRSMQSHGSGRYVLPKIKAARPAQSGTLSSTPTLMPKRK